MKRFALALLLLLTAAPLAAQGIRVDTVGVTVVSPTTIVHITPGPQTIQVGDTVVYHAWGETAAGDSVPVTGTWVTDRTDIVTLLGGEASDSVRVVGRFPGGGVAHISLDPATIIRMDVAAVETGFLPVDADPSASTWEDLIWDRMPRFTALGQTIQACAYAGASAGVSVQKLPCLPLTAQRAAHGHPVGGAQRPLLDVTAE